MFSLGWDKSYIRIDSLCYLDKTQTTNIYSLEYRPKHFTELLSSGSCVRAYDKEAVVPTATPYPPESMKGHDTCGAGTTGVGAWCVVALHKWILGTRWIRKAAFIYISTAGRAARRGHPASVTDTAVLGLPQ